MADSEESTETPGNTAGEPSESPGSDPAAGSDGQRSVTLAADRPVLLFDGVCNLCNRWIQFVIERDPDATFRFAPLQSPVAEEILAACGHEGETLESIVLVEGGDYYTKSDAVIRTGRHLGGVYRLLGPFGILPSRLRNVVYDFVANRRYDWFGRRDQCMVPTPDVEERFLAGGPRAATSGAGASGGDETSP